MKRLLCILLTLLLLTGCTADPAQTTAATTQPPETTAPPKTIAADLGTLTENLPVMDGSTSLIPLEAGIRAALFGITMEEASAQVAHTSTWDSFYNLLWDQVELIFTCPLSAEQWTIAADQGVTLETVPVAMEGFVFVVNAQNPVDTLTQAQLRDIYSGKITNWSEVGGNDEPIIPYQRNRDSGSQNYMTEFMGDVPLMDAPVERRPATMEGLMDVVAVNDNASGAIGYSVYAYAADMYGNGNEIKFIEVDGVSPNKQTFASGEYPLLGKNYAVFRADEPEDSPVRALVNWMTSYDGQTAIAKAGYVTLEDIGFDYQEQRLTLWQGTGSGPAAAEPATYEWNLTHVIHEDWGDDFSEFLPVDVVDGICTIPWITDDALRDEVNAFIADQMTWVPETHDALEEWAELQNRGIEYIGWSSEIPWMLSNFLPADLEYVCFVTAKNGYLSVAVSVCGMNNTSGSEYLPFLTETATWDLLTGRRLEVEDLFCEGVDADAVLNDVVRTYSLNPTDSWGVYPNMKQDFAGLPLTGWHVTHDAIYIDQDNPYFLSGVRIPMDKLPDGTLVSEAPRDFGSAIDHENILVHKSWRMTDRDTRYAYNADGLVSCGFLREEVHPNAAKINAEVMDYLNAYFTRDAILSYYSQFGVGENDLEIWMLDWDLYNLGGRYLLFQGGAPYHMTDREEDRIIYPYLPCLLYDLETGEKASWTVLLKDGWRNAAFGVRAFPSAEACDLPGGELELRSFYPQDGGTADITFFCSGIEYAASIPSDYVNYD